MNAVKKGNFAVVRKLLQNGADTTISNHKNETALSFAMTDNLREILQGKFIFFSSYFNFKYKSKYLYDNLNTQIVSLNIILFKIKNYVKTFQEIFKNN